MRIIKDIVAGSWALGFVRGGLPAVMESDHFEVDWVKMPKERWFADPFVLDVTDEEIMLLVEDYSYATKKGIISLLHINRSTMEISARKELLELPTHLSYPAIWRKDGHIYVYPESAQSGKLKLYEYDTDKEELTFVKTICDDEVWDSYITEAFGEPMLFAAAMDNFHLDIYRWNAPKERYIQYLQLTSDKPNCRMGGAVFEYKGEWYYPAQNCEVVYGGAIDIKRIDVMANDGMSRLRLNEPLSLNDIKFSVESVKHIESPHPRMKLGMHTMNEYKGVVVIDVHGYRYGKLGELMAKLVNLKKRLTNR